MEKKPNHEIFSGGWWNQDFYLVIVGSLIRRNLPKIQSIPSPIPSEILSYPTFFKINIYIYMRVRVCVYYSLFIERLGSYFRWKYWSTYHRSSSHETTWDPHATNIGAASLRLPVWWKMESTHFIQCMNIKIS